MDALWLSFFFNEINAFASASERRNGSCIHSPALPRRVAVVRRDRGAHPPRADHSSAQQGT